jgi:hypothetical protein
VEREYREIVYQRSKNELETCPLGTQRNVYQIGYEWAAHSMMQPTTRTGEELSA